MTSLLMRAAELETKIPDPTLLGALDRFKTPLTKGSLRCIRLSAGDPQGGRESYEGVVRCAESRRKEKWPITAICSCVKAKVKAMAAVTSVPMSGVFLGFLLKGVMVNGFAGRVS